MINLDASTFAQKITEKDVVVLDVRTFEEFNQSHIPDALNIDVQGDYFTADVTALDKSKSYAVYCRSGKRSVLASEVMEQMGIANVYNLIGGIMEWQESCRDTVN
ncbi:MAG: rhodanese-like domain-containing protein [Actinomycetota bacterium]|nr:rhodanese-like domain-containing protein [Actinomycetota bacterium]